MTRFGRMMTTIPTRNPEFLEGASRTPYAGPLLGRPPHDLDGKDLRLLPLDSPPGRNLVDRDKGSDLLSTLTRRSIATIFDGCQLPPSKFAEHVVSEFARHANADLRPQ